MDNRILSISEAAEYMGVIALTLRNWEKKGKISPIRTPGGHRRFKKNDLDVLLGESVDSKDVIKRSIKDLRSVRLSDEKQGNLENILAELKKLL